MRRNLRCQLSLNNSLRSGRGVGPSQLQQVIDYARYLRSRPSADTTTVGSPMALLEALDDSGPLVFAEGELESLLGDIQEMRELDMKDHARLFA